MKQELEVLVSKLAMLVQLPQNYYIFWSYNSILKFLAKALILWVLHTQ